MQNLIILGATGSIGKSALKVLDDLEEFRLVGCSAGSRWEALGAICRARKVPSAALTDPVACEKFRDEFPDITLFEGEDSSRDLVRRTEALRPANHDCLPGPLGETSRDFVEIIGREATIEYLAIYLGMVKYLDDQVGRILNVLDETGLSENTLVLFVGDHGDAAPDRPAAHDGQGADGARPRVGEEQPPRTERRHDTRGCRGEQPESARAPGPGEDGAAEVGRALAAQQFAQEQVHEPVAMRVRRHHTLSIRRRRSTHSARRVRMRRRSDLTPLSVMASSPAISARGRRSA